MEVRTITQIRVYRLILNPMTSRAEAGEVAAVSTDYDKLVDWYHSQIASEPRRVDGWYKVFIPGPLEWYNPADRLELNDLGIFGHGVDDVWVKEDIYYDVIRSGRLYVVE